MTTRYSCKKSLAKLWSSQVRNQWKDWDVSKMSVCSICWMPMITSLKVDLVKERNQNRRLGFIENCWSCTENLKIKGHNQETQPRRSKIHISPSSTTETHLTWKMRSFVSHIKTQLFCTPKRIQQQPEAAAKRTKISTGKTWYQLRDFQRIHRSLLHIILKIKLNQIFRRRWRGTRRKQKSKRRIAFMILRASRHKSILIELRQRRRRFRNHQLIILQRRLQQPKGQLSIQRKDLRKATKAKAQSHQ